MDYDDITESNNDNYGGFDFLQGNICARIKTRWQSLKVGYYWAVSQKVNVFSNPKLLTNIRKSKCILTLYCNARKVSVTQKCDLRGYGTVWYYPGGIANILSL